MNIEPDVAFIDLPMMGPTKKLSGGIRHLPHLADIPIADFELTVNGTPGTKIPLFRVSLLQAAPS